MSNVQIQQVIYQSSTTICHFEFKCLKDTLSSCGAERKSTNTPNKIHISVVQTLKIQSSQSS